MYSIIRPAALVVVAVALMCNGIGAVQVNIGPAQIERAIEIGHRDGTEAQRFHSAYTVQVGHSTVLSFEVITEFRRLVLAKEDQARLGGQPFGAREAERILQPWRGRVSIVAHLRFNPQNALFRVPDYQMSLTGPRGTTEILPIDIRRIPFYSDTTIIGADIEGIFDAAPVARATRTIVLQLPPNQVSAASINFASLE